MIVNDASTFISEWHHNLKRHSRVVNKSITILEVPFILNNGIYSTGEKYDKYKHYEMFIVQGGNRRNFLPQSHLDLWRQRLSIPSEFLRATASFFRCKLSRCQRSQCWCSHHRTSLKKYVRNEIGRNGQLPKSQLTIEKTLAYFVICQYRLKYKKSYRKHLPEPCGPLRFELALWQVEFLEVDHFN